MGNLESEESQVKKRKLYLKFMYLKLSKKQNIIILKTGFGKRNKKHYILEQQYSNSEENKIICYYNRQI